MIKKSLKTQPAHRLLVFTLRYIVISIKVTQHSAQLVSACFTIFIDMSTEVKNRATNPIQITAEQLLREAVDKAGPGHVPVPMQIADQKELDAYRRDKRAEFEVSVRRHNPGNWIKYAQWEEIQGEFRRVRSIYERALQEDYQAVGIWIKYIEFELSHKFVLHAKALYERVTSLLPRIEQFWFKYALLEEQLGNFAETREIYRKWMQWEPRLEGYLYYSKFEERVGELELARAVYETAVQIHPTEEAWLKFAYFEEKQMKDVDRARACYFTGFDREREIGGSLMVYNPSSAGNFSPPAFPLSPSFFLAWANFEERNGGDPKTALSAGLSVIPNSSALSDRQSAIVNRSGNKSEISALLVQRRRELYEARITKSATDTDSWIDLIRLETEAFACGIEGNVSFEGIISLFRRAVSSIPKRAFGSDRVWLSFAEFQEAIEMVEGNMNDRSAKESSRSILTSALSHSPSFALYQKLSNMEISSGDLQAARLVWGRGIGELGSVEIFRGYLEMESRIEGSIDRCRKILEKWVTTFAPINTPCKDPACLLPLCSGAHALAEGWKRWINLEISAGEIERVRVLYRLASQSRSAIAEFFKNWLQLELSRACPQVCSCDCRDRCREVFQKLTAMSWATAGHWLDWIRWELKVNGPASSIAEKAKMVFPEESALFEGLLGEKRQQANERLLTFARGLKK